MSLRNFEQLYEGLFKGYIFPLTHSAVPPSTPTDDEIPAGQPLFPAEIENDPYAASQICLWEDIETEASHGDISDAASPDEEEEELDEKVFCFVCFVLFCRIYLTLIFELF
jgi:hypothetical protein